jgi:hypothetical protein
MVEDEGELENIASNFKFVPWQSVARAFASPLIVDTRSFNPRGTPLEQVDRLLADVAALAQAGELRQSDAKNLRDQLKLARSALQKGRERLAILSLNAFQVQLASLTLRHRVDLDVALSLGFAAEALETWLEQGLRGH